MRIFYSNLQKDLDSSEEIFGLAWLCLTNTVKLFNKVTGFGRERLHFYVQYGNSSTVLYDSVLYLKV